MKHLTYILLALFATCAHAGDDWQEPEKHLGIAAITSGVILYAQEREVAIRHGRDCECVTPIGPGRERSTSREPSIARVNLSFAAGAVAGYLIADALPHEYRKAFLVGTTALELGFVAHNYSLGIRTSF